VVTVDTSIAHLAGALARPTFVLLPFHADWRWRLAREDSDWYPTLRLFRQRAPGDWAGVVSRVGDAIAARTTAKR
jgi:ADP-heptose:LPS heptosyltransferase